MGMRTVGHAGCPDESRIRCRLTFCLWVNVREWRICTVCPVGQQIRHSRALGFDILTECQIQEGGSRILFLPLVPMGIVEGLLPLHQCFGTLEHGKTVLLHVAESRVVLGSLYRRALRAVSDFLLRVRKIKEQARRVPHADEVVGCEIHIWTLLFQQVHTEIVLHVADIQQPQKGRGQIHLPAVSVHDARGYVPPVNHERDVVIRLRAFAFGRAHQFAMVAQEDE